MQHKKKKTENEKETCNAKLSAAPYLTDGPSAARNKGNGNGTGRSKI